MTHFIYERTANYYETDCMGVIHHSNYIRWFEEARVAFLDHIGANYAKMESGGIISPVLSVSCEYKSSVRFADTVLIEVKISDYNGFKLFFDYTVTDKESGDVRTVGKSSHCFIDKEGKLLRLNRVAPELHDIIIGCMNDEKEA